MESVSQGQISSDGCTHRFTETDLANPTCSLTQSRHTDTWPTTPSSDRTTPGACQCRHRTSKDRKTRREKPGSGLRFATASLAWRLRRPPRERKVPGSNPACAGIFSGSSHTSDLKIGTPVATLPGVWRYRVSAGTGRPSVSIL